MLQAAVLGAAAQPALRAGKAYGSVERCSAQAQPHMSRAHVCRSGGSSSESGSSSHHSEDREDARRRLSGGRNGAGAAASGSPGLVGPLACSSLVTRIWGDRPQHDGPINYAQFLEYLVNKRVLRLLIYDHGKNAIVEVCIPGYEDEPYEKMEKQRFSVALPGDYHTEVLRLAKVADRRAAAPQSGNVACRLYYVDPASQYPQLVGQAAGWMLPIVGFWLFLRGMDLVARLRGRKKNMRKEVAAAFGKSRATRTMGMGRGNTGVLFADVAGQDAAIQQFREIISMMLGDQRFVVAGAKLPKGVLLEGPPGTGKTLLAKAVAGEAGVPFFSANGSEFVEMFVGVAAARVRDLFRRARASAPSIVFIDEIDTIGRARTGSSSPDAKEREQGLLQLLVEMDGFDSKRSGVLLIAATNRRDVLDPALLRSGRLDRIIRMDVPDLQGRLAVLDVHAQGKIIPRGADSVSEEFPEAAGGDHLLKTTALLTPGYSGADLANLLNEAAILAVRRNKPMVELAEVETAMEKVKVGLPRAPLEDSAPKRQLALVYAARAVLQTDAPELFPDVLQVSIAPRGTTVARLDSLPSERQWARPGNEVALSWEERMYQVAAMLAGRAAEEELLGLGAASTVTARDLEAATAAAGVLVGITGLYRRRPGPGTAPFNMLTLQVSELPKWPGPVAEAFDSAVTQVVGEAYARARDAVRRLRPAIEAVAAELVELDTVYGTRLRAIVREHPTLPQASVPLFGAEARDFEVPSHSPGCALFAEGSGRVGVASFGRDLAPVWSLAAVTEPQPCYPPVSGMVSFGATGPGRSGIAMFHGWEADVLESAALSDNSMEPAREKQGGIAAAAAAAAALAEQARLAAEKASAIATADAEAHAQAVAQAAAAAAAAAAADKSVEAYGAGGNAQ